MGRRLTIGDSLLEEVIEALGDGDEVLADIGLIIPQLVHLLLQLTELLHGHMIRAAMMNIQLDPLALDGYVC